MMVGKSYLLLSLPTLFLTIDTCMTDKSRSYTTLPAVNASTLSLDLCSTFVLSKPFQPTPTV